MYSENKSVVFYGAGTWANLISKEVRQKYAPVAFCDSDEVKCGNTLFGLPIISLKDVLDKYPDCLFYVTSSEIVKFDIFNTLIQKGISPQRILNYEKSKKYVSCRFLESYMLFDQNRRIQFCCSDFGRNSSPTISIGNSNEQTLQNFIDVRDKLIGELNNPSLYAKSNCNSCMGCYEVKETYWSENRHLRHLNFIFDSFCNFKCSYCMAEFEKKNKEELSDSVEKALSFFRYLERSGQINKDTIIELAAGEITIHPLRDKVLSVIEDYPVWFYSNASNYSDKIAEILAKGRSKLVSSVDAGTRETFAKVKGADIYDNVCENLKRFSEHGFVVLKYIVLPGLNDNEADINGFAELCGKINVGCVDISRDTYNMGAFGEHTIDIIAKLILKLQNMGLNVSAPQWVFSGSDDKERISGKLRRDSK